MVAWLSMALAAPCDLDAPPEAPFEVALPEGISRVQLLVEVWPQPTQDAWARNMLGALTSRGLRGALVVPPEVTDDPTLLGVVAEAVAAGHEIVAALAPDEVPRDIAAGLGPLRARLKPLRKVAGSLHTSVSVLPGKASEALLGRAGFDALIPTDGPSTATPRLAAVFEDQPATNVVLPKGPYAGPCGEDPRVDAWTPDAADRAADALVAALRADGAPTVRVAVLGASDTDAEVLGRWLDEVVLPSGVTVTTPSEARKSALRAARAGVAAPPEAAGLGGRRVTVTQIEAAAEALAGVQILPRTLPEELALAEAFHAMLLVLAGRVEGDVVRLGALSGPTSLVPSALGQEDVVEVPREQVVAFANALLAELPESVPVSMRVGGHLLTAPELLGLLASAVRGEDPSTTRISASPDPNRAGQGWGASTIP